MTGSPDLCVRPLGVHPRQTVRGATHDSAQRIADLHSLRRAVREPGWTTHRGLPPHGKTVEAPYSRFANTGGRRSDLEYGAATVFDAGRTTPNVRTQSPAHERHPPASDENSLLRWDIPPETATPWADARTTADGAVLQILPHSFFGLFVRAFFTHPPRSMHPPRSVGLWACECPNRPPQPGHTLGRRNEPRRSARQI
jgi:hypothetical protein